MALAFMRRHRRWLYVFLWLVIAAFIVLYIPAFQDADAGGPAEVVARVGGLPITAGEFQTAYLGQRRRFEQMYQGRVDPAMMRRLGLEEQVLDGLVFQRVLLLEARRLGLSVDDQTLARAIATAPDLSQDGRFMGAEELRRVLELQGRTVEQFEDERRLQLLAERLEALVTAGISVTPAEAEREFRRRNEQVKAEYVLVEAAPLEVGVEVSDEAARARFEAEREAYRIPEKRIASYVQVGPDDMQGRVTLTDVDLESYYQQRQDEFREEEQVCASHILVKVKSGADATEGHADEEARQIATRLLAEVRDGADFAAVARRASEDQGSASNGGDLGCFGRGRMVPEFENAAFSMAADETSDLVKSSFGYHVIRVTSRRDESLLPLTQVKERIRQTLTAERTDALVRENAEAIAAALRRGKSLEQAAAETGFAVEKSPAMAKGEVSPPLASAALVARVFELKPGEIEPEPFAVGRGGYAFVGLPEAQATRLPELNEVQEKVRADIVEEKAMDAARARAEELSARAGTQGLEKAASSMGLVRKETPAEVGRGQALGDLGSSATLDETVFALPEKTVSPPIRVKDGYAVVRVLEKKPFDPVAFENEKASLMASLRDERKGQLFRAYMSQARQRFTVERNPEAYRRVVG